MTNTELLKQKIDESGYRVDFIFSKLGVSKQTWHNKLNGVYQFKQSEIVVLSKLLNLTQEDIGNIFFVDEDDSES